MSHNLIAVCAMERCFPDDVSSLCAICYHPVFLRPYTANRVGADRRVCLRCFLSLQGHGHPMPVVLSAESLTELRLFYADVGTPQ